MREHSSSLHIPYAKNLEQIQSLTNKLVNYRETVAKRHKQVNRLVNQIERTGVTIPGFISNHSGRLDGPIITISETTVDISKSIDMWRGHLTNLFLGIQALTAQISELVSTSSDSSHPLPGHNLCISKRNGPIDRMVSQYNLLRSEFCELGKIFTLKIYSCFWKESNFELT